jgi:hypothetical protein
MQISTKTLASLLVVTSAAIMPGTTRRSKGWQKKSRFDRVLQRHDRKGELRAGLLSVPPQEFRELQKKHSFEEVVRRHGFLNEQEFCVALSGKIKSELRRRGWTPHKIETYVSNRKQRLI